jgi:hypothetical protein
VPPVHLERRHHGCPGEILRIRDFDDLEADVSLLLHRKEGVFRVLRDYLISDAKLAVHMRLEELLNYKVAPICDSSGNQALSSADAPVWRISKLFRGFCA